MYLIKPLSRHDASLFTRLNLAVAGVLGVQLQGLAPEDAPGAGKSTIIVRNMSLLLVVFFSLSFSYSLFGDAPRVNISYVPQIAIIILKQTTTI